MEEGSEDATHFERAVDERFVQIDNKTLFADITGTNGRQKAVFIL